MLVGQENLVRDWYGQNSSPRKLTQYYEFGYAVKNVHEPCLLTGRILSYMIINKYRLREYLGENGKNPFREWLECLTPTVAARIQARIFRLEQGNLGDFKAVGHGVCELRLAFGPGYRVYFGFDGKEVIILLAGGDKASQRRDIITARRYWLDYQSRRSHES